MGRHYSAEERLSSMAAIRRHTLPGLRLAGEPEQAFSYYHGLAYSYRQLQKLDEAQKAG
jgi:hypothetical protein